MKLYIPTCTLNFNNIFSSESISPLSFYMKRGFGNKRFYSVPANSIDDVIVLYSKFPRFQVENSDIENYPMVIEVETQDYPEGYFNKVLEKDSVEVFICSHTIYLNPFHCFVYFYNYESRQGVLTKAEQSLENKFNKLYSANLIIKQEEKKSWLGNIFNQTEYDDFSWSSSYMPSDLPELESDYKKDIIIDKIRGFLYCYLIGANQSVSSETGKLKAIARNLRNTLSAVVNSPDKTPTSIQDNTLLKGIMEFNKIFFSKDEDSINNRQILEAKLCKNPLGLSFNECVELLKSWDLYDIYCSKNNLKQVYDANELWLCLEYPGAESFSRVINNLQNAVRKIEYADLLSCEKHFIGNVIKLEEGLNVKILDRSYNSNFYQSLIHSQIRADYIAIMNENSVEEPEAQAFNGGRILKSIMGEEWENSNVATYINSLLSHLQDHTSFELFSLPNDVMVSFAAFCQKGDDIERLSEYLIQCGFTNYRLAYGIYGATRGFASLPKTFTSVLINSNKEYYKENFLYIYNQIFGIHIINADFPVRKIGNESNLVENEIGSTIIENIAKIEQKPFKQRHIVDAVSQAIDLEEAVQNPRAFMYIADNILSKNSGVYKALVKANFINDTNKYTEESFRNKIYSIIESSLPTSKQSKKDTIEKINQILLLEAKRQDSKAFLYILDNFIDRKSKAYKNIIKIIQDVNLRSQSHCQNIPQINTENDYKIRFAPQNLKLITSLVCELNPGLSEFANKQIVKDLEWVFNPQYSKGKSEMELLESFRNVLSKGKTQQTSKNGNDMKWKNDAYRPLDIERTIQTLKEHLQ